MKFVPKLYDRTKGDFVSSEKMNKDARDMYADVTELFEREMALLAKSKMLSDAIGAVAYGYMEASKSTITLPTVNVDTDFFFPEGKNQIVVDKIFNEFILPTETERNEILDVTGKLKGTISVDRSSDNLVFSKKPEAITESSPRFAVEQSDYPYFTRVVGSNEPVYIRMDVTSSVEPIAANVIEFIPYPYVGGTELIDVKLSSEETGNIPVEDAAFNKIFITSADIYYRHRPVRLCISDNNINRLSLTTRGNALVLSNDTVIGGITSIKAINRVYSSIAYIGFTIQGTAGYTLKSIKPVTKWSNSYLGTINTKVYDSMESAKLLSNNELTSFDNDGTGLAVNASNDLYVVVEISSDINATPQLLGFDVTIE